MFPVDITSADQVRFVEQLQAIQFSWNTLISAVGLLDPINSFSPLISIVGRIVLLQTQQLN